MPHPCRHPSLGVECALAFGISTIFLAASKRSSTANSVTPYVRFSKNVAGFKSVMDDWVLAVVEATKGGGIVLNFLDFDMRRQLPGTYGRPLPPLPTGAKPGTRGD